MAHFVFSCLNVYKLNCEMGNTHIHLDAVTHAHMWIWLILYIYIYILTTQFIHLSVESILQCTVSRLCRYVSSFYWLYTYFHFLIVCEKNRPWPCVWMNPGESWAHHVFGVLAYCVRKKIEHNVIDLSVPAFYHEIFVLWCVATTEVWNHFTSRELSQSSFTNLISSNYNGFAGLYGIIW